MPDSLPAAEGDGGQEGPASRRSKHRRQRSLAPATSAEKAELHLQDLQKTDSCTFYSDADIEGLDCKSVVIEAGDTFYMPKGLVHYAEAVGEGTTSVHATVALERKQATWLDLVVAEMITNQDELDNGKELLKLVAKAVGSTQLGLRLAQLAPVGTVGLLSGEAPEQALQDYLSDLIVAVRNVVDRLVPSGAARSGKDGVGAADSVSVAQSARDWFQSLRAAFAVEAPAAPRVPASAAAAAAATAVEHDGRKGAPGSNQHRHESHKSIAERVAVLKEEFMNPLQAYKRSQPPGHVHFASEQCEPDFFRAAAAGGSRGKGRAQTAARTKKADAADQKKWASLPAFMKERNYGREHYGGVSNYYNFEENMGAGDQHQYRYRRATNHGAKTCTSGCTSGCIHNCNEDCDESCDASSGCDKSCDSNCNGCISGCNEDCTCNAGHGGADCAPCSEHTYKPSSGNEACGPRTTCSGHDAPLAPPSPSSPLQQEPCAADHGSSTACCGHPNLPVEKALQCPSAYPTCTGFVRDSHFGRCTGPSPPPPPPRAELWLHNQLHCR